MTGTIPAAAARLRIEHVDAVIFDLDGVVTDTASLHAAAWKQAFDQLLASRTGSRARLFDPVGEYRMFVDGRPRFDGAQSFLISRGIDLAAGSHGDAPGTGTVWAVANLKNDIFHALLSKSGVRVFPSALALLKQLRRAGVRTAIVTASRNAGEILDRAGIRSLADSIVDGVDATSLGLPGKPDPATYLEAARRLNVSPDRAAVIEDAISGVEAASRGGFALVIGVGRDDADRSLTRAGADFVVEDLSELPLDLTRLHALPGMAGPEPDFCGGGFPRSDWILAYDGYDPLREGLREALCTTGNGYLATRGAAPECAADGVHYPGSYLAGVYNRLATTVADGHRLEHEHLVNVPNWLPLRLRINGQAWFTPESSDITSYRQELNLRAGVLTRDIRFQDQQGRHTRLVQHRFTHMAQPHLVAMESVITAEDWAGSVEVESAIDGGVSNSNLPDDAPLAKTHLITESASNPEPGTVVLVSTTNQSRIRIAVAARTDARDTAGHSIPLIQTPSTGRNDYAGTRFTIELTPQRPVTVEKIAAVATSRDPAISEPASAVITELANAGTFDELRLDHERAWARLWERFDITLDAAAEVTLALRLHTFHLLQTLSPHTAQIDAGVPARGLHGEGYHGHVFWDAMFAFPALNLRLPGLTRSLLLYRWRRLDAARRAAKAHGKRGAMFPWQSASDGREVTPRELFDTTTGRWLRDHSHLQRHIGISIAYDVWQYYQATGDVSFMADYGAELIIEITRYLASLTEYDPADGRFGIAGVVGPDEYHDTDPASGLPGLRDNAYTNVMTSWVLQRALDVIDLLAGYPCGQLWEQLGISQAETARWEAMSRQMRVVFHDGVISQFAGYETLAEFDWESYRAAHGDFVGIDAVLRARGEDPNRYKLSKQADVLMLFYLLSTEELQETFTRLGYRLQAKTMRKTVSYYLARVAHGSSLSRIAHAWVQARGNREQSWSLFTEALQADLADTRGGTTRTGIHLGAMAGTVDIVLRCYTGLEMRHDRLYVNPRLPRKIRTLHAELLYRGHWIVMDITHQTTRLTLRPCQAPPITVCVCGQQQQLSAGQSLSIPRLR
ncbi:beta-phosphoglucomutase family hydrolase [Catelliglobosispora koreensis]|uniref:beta-phosphoglucomutase family hydrolase n=1 Tax=Catelliglobosispora koreensis TaxID=129052 RepID=UPI0003817E70|nr:beta-phosphoglucomutase family hydrolase [Catelliglobosispora koreensis]